MGTPAVVALYDRKTRAAVTIALGEHRVHDGRSFIHADDFDLTQDAVHKKMINAPNSDIVECHLSFDVHGTAEYELRLSETPTAVSGGTYLTLINRNRRVTHTAETKLIGSITATTGLTLWIGHFGATDSPAQSTGGSSGSEEFILAKNKNYLIELTAKAAGSFSMVVNVEEVYPQYQ